MDTLQNRLAALSIEMNRIKDEINFHSSSIQSVDSGHNSAFLKATNWKGTAKSHEFYPEINSDPSSPWKGNLFQENLNETRQDDPLDIKHLLSENESVLDWMELNNFVKCVDDVCHDDLDHQDQDIDEKIPAEQQIIDQDTVNENDFIDLVNKAIENISEAENRKAGGPQVGSSNNTPLAIPDAKSIIPNAKPSPKMHLYAKPLYQIPKLQYYPLDEEGDTLLEVINDVHSLFIFKSAARPIQNKYLYISEEEQSVYPLREISHYQSNDMSIGSLEYLKRHQLHSMIQPKRNQYQSSQEPSSRFLDIEKLRKLKKLK